MPKIHIYIKEDRELLRDEYLAYEENRKRDILNSIRNRTMTRKSYLEVTHGLRKFFWHLRQNRFITKVYE